MIDYKDGDQIPCMRMKITERTEDIFVSKFGGVGYIPHDSNFPVDNEGRQLRFLAQIDCSKVTLPEYPKSGLLQFWILNDDVYGLDFDNQTNQNTFRVIYYPTVDTTVTRDEVIDKIVKHDWDDYEYGMPIENNGEFAVEIYESISTYYDFSDEKYDYLDEDPEDYGGHMIGGIPIFTQEDPRWQEDLQDYDYLLFQMDSDYKQGEYEILWGDSGVCNFFIKTESLKACDFSDVLYNWDCC